MNFPGISCMKYLTICARSNYINFIDSFGESLTQFSQSDLLNCVALFIFIRESWIFICGKIVCVLLTVKISRAVC